MSDFVADAALRGDRAAGIGLVAAAAGTLLAMSHHPSGAHAGAHAGALGAMVHGVMIFLAAMMGFGFAHFALRRGLARPEVLAGLVGYAIGLFAHVGAATINGFVVPALAARGHGAVGRDLFLLAWEANQALARLGVLATGAAFTLWSIDFLRRQGLEARLIGTAGLAAGAAPATLLASGWIDMDVAGATAIYAAHGVWAALVGLHVIRGKLRSAHGRESA